MGRVRLQPSPDGAWHLPDHTVSIQPQSEPGEYEALRLARDGGRWEVVADYRNLMLWDTRTAMAVPNRLALGERLPTGVTLSRPHSLDGTTPHCNAWDEATGSWRLLPDYSGRALWNKADGSSARPLDRGEPLPDNVTDLRPTGAGAGSIRFDDERGEWVVTPAPEIGA